MKGLIAGIGQRLGSRLGQRAGYAAVVVLLLFLWGFQVSKGMEASSSSGESWADEQFRQYHVMRQSLEELHIRPIHTLWESVVEYPLLSGLALRKEWERIQKEFEAVGANTENRGKRLFSFAFTEAKGLAGVASFHEIYERPDAYRATLIVKLETKDEVTPAEEKKVMQVLKMLKKKHEDPYIYTCIKAVNNGTLNTLRTRLHSILSEKMKGTWGEFYQEPKSWSARISGEASLQVLLHEQTGEKGTEIILGTPYIVTEF